MSPFDNLARTRTVGPRRASSSDGKSPIHSRPSSHRRSLDLEPCLGKPLVSGACQAGAFIAQICAKPCLSKRFFSDSQAFDMSCGAPRISQREKAASNRSNPQEISEYSVNGQNATPRELQQFYPRKVRSHFCGLSSRQEACPLIASNSNWPATQVNNFVSGK